MASKAVERISVIIDSADFLDEESLESLTNKVTDWAEGYADDSEYLSQLKAAMSVEE